MSLAKAECGTGAKLLDPAQWWANSLILSQPPSPDRGSKQVHKVSLGDCTVLQVFADLEPVPDSGTEWRCHSATVRLPIVFLHL